VSEACDHGDQSEQIGRRPRHDAGLAA